MQSMMMMMMMMMGRITSFQAICVSLCTRYVKVQVPLSRTVMELAIYLFIYLFIYFVCVCVQQMYNVYLTHRCC